MSFIPSQHSLQPRYAEELVWMHTPSNFPTEDWKSISLFNESHQSCLVLTVKVMVWRIFSQSTLAPLVTTEHYLNTAACLQSFYDHSLPSLRWLFPAGQHVSWTTFFNMTLSSLTVFKLPPKSWVWSWQICSSCVALSCQYGDLDLWWMF